MSQSEDWTPIRGQHSEPIDNQRPIATHHGALVVERPSGDVEPVVALMSENRLLQLGRASARYCVTHQFGGRTRQGPSKMPMPRVVKHVRLATPTDTWQHVWHHGSQTAPGNNATGVDVGKILPGPANQWSNPVGADVVVDTVDFGSAGHSEAILAQPARDDLGRVVEQTYPRSPCLASFIVEMNRYRVSLDRINIHPIAQHAGKASAGHAGAKYDPVEPLL